MSTPHILDMLHHHDQPCAVLERIAPRFMPFELGVTLEHALTASHPRVPASLLYAFCNALTDQPCWVLPSKMTVRLATSPSKITHVSLLHSPPYHISLEFYQSSIKSTMLLCHLPHITGLEHMLVLSIPFVHYIEYPEQRTPPEELRKLYAYAIFEGLAEHGATELSEKIESDLEILTSREHILVSIPLATATIHIKALHDMLTNQDIVAQDVDEKSALVPGPFALRAAHKLGLENHELTQWLDGSLRSFGVEDIPF